MKLKKTIHVYIFKLKSNIYKIGARVIQISKDFLIEEYRTLESFLLLKKDSQADDFEIWFNQKIINNTIYTIK